MREIKYIPRISDVICLVWHADKGGRKSNSVSHDISPVVCIFNPQNTKKNIFQNAFFNFLKPFLNVSHALLAFLGRQDSKITDEITKTEFVMTLRFVLGIVGYGGEMGGGVKRGAFPEWRFHRAYFPNIV